MTAKSSRLIRIVGETAVQVLAVQIMADLKDTMATFFGVNWTRGESPAGVVAATINDYLQGYAGEMDDYFHRKLAYEVTARAVASYARKLDHKLHPSKKVRHSPCTCHRH